MADQDIAELQNRKIVKTLLFSIHKKDFDDKYIEEIYSRCDGNPWNALIVELNLLKEKLGIFENITVEPADVPGTVVKEDLA
jgi:hypothetical protein